MSKAFGGIAALRDVSFDVRGGEVVALAGENGAGKSTIKNIIGGNLRADAGAVLIDGRPPATGVGGARGRGVATVHQETSLFPDLSVAENIFITKLRTGRRLAVVSPRSLNRAAAPLLRQVGAAFEPDVAVRDLSTGQRQLVEIAKALAAEPAGDRVRRADRVAESRRA